MSNFDIPTESLTQFLRVGFTGLVNIKVSLALVLDKYKHLLISINGTKQQSEQIDLTFLYSSTYWNPFTRTFSHSKMCFWLMVKL